MKTNEEINLINTIHICVVSNIGLNPLFVSILGEVFLGHKVNLQISFVTLEEMYEVNNIDIIKRSDYIVYWFDLCDEYSDFQAMFADDALMDYFDTYCLRVLNYIRSITKSKIFCLSIADFPCRSDIYLGSLLNKTVIRCNLSLVENQNALDLDIINLEKLISKCGYAEAYSNKNYRRWNSKYSLRLYKRVADEIYKRFLINKGITKKCIVVDCDNVLWGGILSEEGIEGIEIGSNGFGKSFQDFQRYLLDLYYHGVILAVCSKNDELDVMRVFNEHTGMLLKEEHVACFKCNWNNKPDNIREIADVLNIGLDSIVFIDDSVFEINSVNLILPEVATVLYEKNMVYDRLSCFNLKYKIDLETVLERTNTYRSNRHRAKLQENASSYEDYILSLEMVVDIHRAKDYELTRISELTQRTNKCTNGVRYTLGQIKIKNTDKQYELYVVSLSDKFSDLGIVGVIGLQGKCADLLALSCRALGRKIEDRMLCWIMNKKITSIRFISTGKNENLRNLLDSTGTMMLHS